VQPAQSAEQRGNTDQHEPLTQAVHHPITAQPLHRSFALVLPPFRPLPALLLVTRRCCCRGCQCPCSLRAPVMEAWCTATQPCAFDHMPCSASVCRACTAPLCSARRPAGQPDASRTGACKENAGFFGTYGCAVRSKGQTRAELEIAHGWGLSYVLKCAESEYGTVMAWFGLTLKLGDFESFKKRQIKESERRAA
jgi:hypothetical protein